MADNCSYSAAAVVAMARGVVRLPSNVKHKASSVVQQLGYVSTQLLQIRTCHSIKHTYSYIFQFTYTCIVEVGLTIAHKLEDVSERHEAEPEAGFPLSGHIANQHGLTLAQHHLQLLQPLQQTLGEGGGAQAIKVL